MGRYHSKEESEAEDTNKSRVHAGLFLPLFFNSLQVLTKVFEIIGLFFKQKFRIFVEQNMDLCVKAKTGQKCQVLAF